MKLEMELPLLLFLPERSMNKDLRRSKLELTQPTSKEVLIKLLTSFQRNSTPDQLKLEEKKPFLMSLLSLLMEIEKLEICLPISMKKLECMAPSQSNKERPFIMRSSLLMDLSSIEDISLLTLSLIKRNKK